MRTVRSRGVFRDAEITPAAATMVRMANSNASRGRTTASSSIGVSPGSARISAFGACFRNSSRNSSPSTGTNAMISAGEALDRSTAALSMLFATSTSRPSDSRIVRYGAAATGGGAYSNA